MIQRLSSSSTIDHYSLYGAARKDKIIDVWTSRYRGTFEIFQNSTYVYTGRLTGNLFSYLQRIVKEKGGGGRGEGASILIESSEYFSLFNVHD